MISSPAKTPVSRSKPLEALMRRRLPAIERAALIRIDAGGLDADKELPTAFALAELGDGPCWPQASCRVPAGRRADSSGIAGPPGAPATWRASQPSTCSTKAQGSDSAGFDGIRSSSCGDHAGVDRGLPQRREPEFLEEARRDHEADRLDMVEPFKVRVSIEVSSPWRSPRSRPEIDEADRLEPMGAHFIGVAQTRSGSSRSSRSSRASRLSQCRRSASRSRRSSGTRSRVSWSGSNSLAALPIRDRCCSSRSASDRASCSPRFTSCALHRQQVARQRSFSSAGTRSAMSLATRA